LQALFDRKAAKLSITGDDISNTNNTYTQFSNRNVFTQNYSKRFDELAKHYGFLLSHQSDRDLPRTHVNTNYTTITRKNANEMSGILITILIVFSTDEGTNTLDQIMAGLEAAKFIQLFELLLMLENFCSFPEHKIIDVKNFKKFVPYILNTYKDILDRQTGCGCKFIKFHLPNHFADDMLRFGSMLNFDTGIGESHHKTEAKYPAKNTQRRKAEFEYQTATRQIENFAINKAFAYFEKNSKQNYIDVDDDSYTDNIDQWFRYQYDPNEGLQQKYGKTEFKTCKWSDEVFQTQLTQICTMIYKNGCIDGPLWFFALHNRQSYIFRADPNYQSNLCWYDWAEVNWSGQMLPTKLLLFWDIKQNTLKKSFKVGDIKITQPGQYVLCYTLQSTKKLQPAHTTSMLVQYGKLHTDSNNKPILYIFHIDCIASTISAVPYKVKDTIFNAIEWLFLKPKSEWYSKFMTMMKNELEKEKSTTNTQEISKKRKPN
jgi:hypothetical protein